MKYGVSLVYGSVLSAVVAVVVVTVAADAGCVPEEASVSVDVVTADVVVSELSSVR